MPLHRLTKLKKYSCPSSAVKNEESAQVWQRGGGNKNFQSCLWISYREVASVIQVRGRRAEGAYIEEIN